VTFAGRGGGGKVADGTASGTHRCFVAIVHGRTVLAPRRTRI
jgi:hypothetical protein